MSDFNLESVPDYCPMCSESGLIEMQDKNQMGCEECGTIFTITIDHVGKDWIEPND